MLKQLSNTFRLLSNLAKKSEKLVKLVEMEVNNSNIVSNHSSVAPSSTDAVDVPTLELLGWQIGFDLVKVGAEISLVALCALGLAGNVMILRVSNYMVKTHNKTGQFTFFLIFRPHKFFVYGGGNHNLFFPKFCQISTLLLHLVNTNLYIQVSNVQLVVSLPGKHEVVGSYPCWNLNFWPKISL